MSRYRIAIRGVVQGVGFRPFVKRLADSRAINGNVSNNGAGVVIHVDVHREAEAHAFLHAIRTEAPPLARIEECAIEAVEQDTAPPGPGFTIVESTRAEGAVFTLISPDIAACADCLHELRDPHDRRFAYPFTNCTNCGPRYSIILHTPYDRANTTMAPFAMCAECAAEYASPADRRFHAEPIACAVCGPSLSATIEEAWEALSRGEIVAVKGLGGFQLACDAFSAQAVRTMRERKRRSRKPFALMMRDLETVRRFCELSAAESALLTSRAAPIVILKLKSLKINEKSVFPAGVAPGLNELGVMLPYTPLHHLLLDGPLTCLVMTSGNISEEPIVISNDEARTRLAGLADRFLIHNRDIFMRVDDSVARVADGVPRLLRRSRGYAPSAIDLGFDYGEVLACGAELKNTMCLTKGRYAILSQHIGDLENFETLRFFEETLANLKQIWRAQPAIIAHDLHPGYLGANWARKQDLPLVAVQHHHAHVASCMAENRLRERVIGVAFDGTGYGTDGQIWGGEFLVADYSGFERAAHLRYVPLVGGDQAARQSWRMAAAHLRDAFGPGYRQLNLPLWTCAGEAAWRLFDQLLSKPALLTSSCGRLFDAVSALAGICVESGYEGEAAMLLEAAAFSDGDLEFPYEIDDSTWPWTLDTRPMIRAIAEKCIARSSPGRIAGAFHRTMGHMIEATCMRLREKTGLETICLSGGAFQNFTLVSDVIPRLTRAGFQVFTHSLVPPNDGGISLGQAAVAAHALQHDHVSQQERK